MGKLTAVVPHLSAEEIKQRIKKTAGFRRVQKWLVILNALVDPRPAQEIAHHTGLATQTVHNLVSQYNRRGPQVLEGPGKGGRRRAYLSRAEEASFLEPFVQKAHTGQVATVREIKQALERHIGASVHKTTVYRLLRRQGWRKVVPRPYHAAAKPEEQKAFKKTFLKE